MKYSNDESDKARRRRNFTLSVYVLPLVVIFAISFAIYFAAQRKWLTGADSRSAYLFSLCAGAIVYVMNIRKWQRMSDGSHHYMIAVFPSPKTSVNEPTNYEEEYYNSKRGKANAVLLGLTVIGMGIYLGIETDNTIPITLLNVLVGMVLTYSGIRGLRERKPKLKLAKEGLWTQKLGFIDWKDIARAQVLENTNGKTTETILEIYLKGSIFAESAQPDERLFLTELEDKQYVEMAVETLMSKRNNNS